MHVTLFEDTLKNVKVGKRPKRGTKSSNFGASFFVPILELRSRKMALSLFVVVVGLSLHHRVNQPTKEPTYQRTKQRSKHASKQTTNQAMSQPTNPPTHQPTNQRKEERNELERPPHALLTHSQSILRSGSMPSLSP